MNKLCERTARSPCQQNFFTCQASWQGLSNFSGASFSLTKLIHQPDKRAGVQASIRVNNCRKQPQETNHETLNSILAILAVLAAPSLLRADGQSDAAARAKAVAPYVDDMTVAVAHVDLSRVDAASLVETLARLMPDATDLQGGLQSEAAKRIDKCLKAGLQAGVKDVYITVSLGGPGPIPTVLTVLPIPATADEQAVRAALDIPAKAGRRVGNALVIRSTLDNGPIETHSDPLLAAAGIDHRLRGGRRGSGPGGVDSSRLHPPG